MLPAASTLRRSVLLQKAIGYGYRVTLSSVRADRRPRPSPGW